MKQNMQEKFLYEYSIIKLIPRVERGEYLNVGVIVYCKKASFLNVLFALDKSRLTAIFPQIDIEEINGHLVAFEQICLGNSGAGPIAAIDMASRFRWLTAKRSTIIQASDVHPGLCENAAETLARLFEQLVLI